MNRVSIMTIKLLEVNELYFNFHFRVVICIVNDFWLKTEDPHRWIFSTWTENCDIHLCSRGFFVVNFDTLKFLDYIFKEGPWFWGNVGLFIIPWFLAFDANTMVVSEIPVWVRLHNLPLHFWHHKVLK